MRAASPKKGPGGSLSYGSKLIERGFYDRRIRVRRRSLQLDGTNINIHLYSIVRDRSSVAENFLSSSRIFRNSSPLIPIFSLIEALGLLWMMFESRMLNTLETDDGSLKWSYFNNAAIA